MIESIGLNDFSFSFLRTQKTTSKVIENEGLPDKVVETVQHVIVYEKNGKVSPTYQTNIDHTV